MRPIPIDAFTRFHFLSALAFAPGGRHAAFAVSRAQEDLRGYQSELWLYDARGGAPRPLTAGGKESAFAWVDERTLLFAAARTDADKKAAEAGPYTAFYSLPIDGGEARPAFSVPLRGATAQRAAGGYLLRATYDPQDEQPRDDAPKADVRVLEEIPFWANGKAFVNQKRARLYFLPGGGALRALTTPLGQVGAHALSPDGAWVAYAMATFDSVNPQKQGVYVTELDTGETRELLPGGTYSIGNIAFLGDMLVLSMADGARYGTSENSRVYTLPLAGGAPSLLAAPDTDVCGGIASDCRLGGGTTFKADGGSLYLTLAIDHKNHLYRLGQNGVLTSCTDGSVTVDCFDVSDGNVLFVGMTADSLQGLYALDTAQKAARRLDSINAQALGEYDLSTPQPLSFVNDDGIRVDGWVLLPPDYDGARRYPAILSIHGGPKAIYGTVLHHEMQFWAGQGYIVFFCNPRGSGGRGDAFADLRGKYGTVDYSDLMAFTDLVLDTYPAIDPARVCVAGGSYGGFMVNWIIGHTGRFAAASSQRSIANWTSKALTTDIGYYHNLSQIAGDPWSTPALFWDKSPLKYAPDVTTPTMFVHADEDYRCWMAEGLQMFTALKMHGVPTRLCLFSGENHELSRSGKPVNRIRRLREITDWFDRYTGRAAEQSDG